MKTPSTNFVVGGFYKIIKLPLTSYIDGLEDFPILYIGYSFVDADTFKRVSVETIHSFFSINKNKFYYISESDILCQYVFIEEIS